MSKVKHEGIPLGEAESERLEFKSREVLRDPRSVGKSVVAFLNAEGGDLWIGLAEADERAVAVEPIEEPLRQARRVHDFLVDTIEPPLTVEVDVAAVEQILRVRVAPKAVSRPYAFVKDGARHFLVRVGARNRPMTREEIFKARPPATQGTDGLQRAIQALEKLRERARKVGVRRLWMGVKPVEPLKINVQDPTLKALLLNPSRSGNRRTGWTFANPYQEPSLAKDRIYSGKADQRFTTIFSDGTIEFSAPIESVTWMGKPLDLWPYCVMEYPVSVMRLAGTLLNTTGQPPGDTRILADLAMFGIAGMKLGAYSPESIWYQTELPTVYPGEEPDLEWKPLIFDREEVVNEPDRCGFRQVRRIYEAFGHGEDKIPQEFNRKEMRLVLSD